jgi:hypothetical protein
MPACVLIGLHLAGMLVAHGGSMRERGAVVAELAERDYGGRPVSDEEWARVFAVFGGR